MAERWREASRTPWESSDLRHRVNDAQSHCRSHFVVDESHMSVAEQSKRLDFSVTQLGECRFPSPLSSVRFIRDNEHVLYDAQLDALKASLAEHVDPPSMEVAGPREKLFFDPS